MMLSQNINGDQNVTLVLYYVNNALFRNCFLYFGLS